MKIHFIFKSLVGGSEKSQEDKFGIIVSADDPELLDKLNHGADEGQTSTQCSSLTLMLFHLEFHHF